MPGHTTALFADRHAAHAAIEQLVQAGFPRDTISVLMTESTLVREFGGGDATESSGVRTIPRHGGVLRAIVASLLTLSAPGGLSLRAGGPLASALVRDATEEPLHAALALAGLPAQDASFVDAGVRAGSIAVGVHANAERGELAIQLLELAGGKALKAA